MILSSVRMLLLRSQRGNKTPQCCRCNGGGKCRNCVCAKANRRCTNCLPSRKGCCSNTAPVSASGISPSTSTPAPFSAVPPVDNSHVVPTSPPPLSPSLTDPTVSPCSSQAPHSSIADPPNNAHSIPSLPSPTPMANPSFVWGSLSAHAFIRTISSAYSEVVHWKRNSFVVPYGNAGKKFVYELSTLYRAYAEGSALESIALKAITVMSISETIRQI